MIYSGYMNTKKLIPKPASVSSKDKKKSKGMGRRKAKKAAGK